MSDAAAGQSIDGGSALCPHVMTPEEAADRMALQHLVATYGHAIDRRDYALLQTLYHPDAIDDHSPYFHGSPAEYAAWLPEMMANWRATAHVMLNMVFVVEDDHAEGIISARTWHLTADGSREFTAWGRYADRYAKRDGIWRFAHRFFILDSTEECPAQGQDSFGTQGVALGAAGRDDPVFQRLPMIGRQR